jgi:hypothetical protein
MCACVGSLSNRLQMPRQRKELWAIVRGASRPHHTHTHTHSYTRMRVSCVCVCVCVHVRVVFLPKLSSEMDGRNTQHQPHPPKRACARAWRVAVCRAPSHRVCVLQKGGVGIAQCAVRTMPTTDANTACPTQNNPARAHTHVIHTVVATAAAAAAGWRRTAVRSVALSNVYYYYYYYY